MLTERQMTTLRKIAVRLRELKPILDRVSREVEESRTLLPERHWRQEIDDEMCEIGCAIDDASMQISDAVEALARVTGEDEVVERVEPPPLPDKLPTYEEIDANRRAEASAIRERQRREGP